MERARHAVGLFGVISFAAVGVAWLQRLGQVPALRVPVDDLAGWLATAAAADVVMAGLRLVGLACAWWLLVSTGLYAAARAARLPGMVRAAGWLTLPLARRLADRAVAVALSASAAVSAGAVPALAVRVPPPVAVATVEDSADSEAASGLRAAISPAPTPPPGAVVPPTPPPGPVVPPGARPGLVVPPGAPPLGPRPAQGSNLPAEPAPAVPSDGAVTGPPAPTPAEDGEPPAVDGQPPAVDGPPPAADLHVVERGDNLWSIAAGVLDGRADRGAAGSDATAIAAYWLLVVDENRPLLRSGDPDLIFPGEQIRTPAPPHSHVQTRR